MKPALQKARGRGNKTNKVVFVISAKNIILELARIINKIV
jgi:hypothetical protein